MPEKEKIEVDDSKVKFELSENFDEFPVYTGEELPDSSDETEEKIDTTESLQAELRRYPPMEKYAGAQITKYFKITALGDTKVGYSTFVKEGRLGEQLKSKTKKHKDFKTACEYAEKQIEKKKSEGFKQR